MTCLASRRWNSKAVVVSGLFRCQINVIVPVYPKDSKDYGIYATSKLLEKTEASMNCCNFGQPQAVGNIKKPKKTGVIRIVAANQRNQLL